MAFTTKDRDQDTYYKNCALLKHGGYWYYDCNASNLNGKYQLTKGQDMTQRFYWNCCNVLSASQMKFRKAKY